MEGAAGLVVFDLDGVLVPIDSSWGYVHRLLGTTEAAEVNYRLYRLGVIGYWEWMYLDTLAWVEASPGLTRWELEEMFRPVKPFSEAREAVRLLHRRGFLVAIVTGGVDVFAYRVASEVGADYWAANILAFDPWGRLVPGGYPMVEADRKDRVVRVLAAEAGVPMNRVAFVGDSRWDIRGMMESGFAVAVNPKDNEVVAAADYVAGDVLEAAEVISSVFKPVTGCNVVG